jgi:hypothetical protein
MTIKAVTTSIFDTNSGDMIVTVHVPTGINYKSTCFYVTSGKLASGEFISTVEDGSKADLNWLPEARLPLTEATRKAIRKDAIRITPGYSIRLTAAGDAIMVAGNGWVDA